MRIGLFGGTFNPIHYGHLRPAQEVADAFKLDSVHFIPSAIPPHKMGQEIVSAHARVEMLKIALSAHPVFTLSDIEIQREGPSYTIDTVHQLKKVVPPSAALYLIMGLDAFLEIDSWCDYKAIFDAFPMIVLSRPDARQSGAVAASEQMAAVLRKISKNYTYAPADRQFSHHDKPTVYLQQVTALDISSTQIRHLIGMGRSPRYLLPEAVEHYIIKKGLYA
jgi:nicotinate-nucleotide adenylyltransferase